MYHREQLPIGAELVGDYRIDGVLGQGGFGITYKAWHLGLDKFVAVKEYFPSEFAKRDDTLSLSPTTPKSAEMFDWGRKRFLDEAKTLAKFGHPSIVRVHHVFEALNTAYMVLEYEDGQSLRHWLDDLGRPATQAELDDIVPPLLDALAEMHAADFIHRDIAPDNIIVRPDGSPVLLDFGAARQAIAAETKTLTGIVKAGYSPPEQYLTEPGRQGPWTDIYAFGATLYRVVTGVAPPEAPARQIDATYVPAASAAQGEYRLAFLPAIDWALKLKMQERPQSISVFQDALSGAQKGLGEASSQGPLSSSRGASAPMPTEPTPQPPRRSFSVGLKWAAAVLIVTAGGIGGYFAYDHFETERQRVQALADAEKARVVRLEREAEEGRRKAVADRKRAEEARRRSDEQAWQQAKRSDTLVAYQAYLKNHPNGIYKEAALARVAALEAEAKRKAEAERRRRNSGSSFGRPDETRVLKTFGKWRVFRHNDPDQQICFSASSPISSFPKLSSRGNIYFYISTWLNNKVSEEVSILLGYLSARKAQTIVTVNSRTFKLFNKGQKAYFATTERERLFLRTIRQGSNMKVRSKSAAGVQTTDTYSLSGVADALRHMAQVCPPKVGKQ